jgi:Mobilization protein NikA
MATTRPHRTLVRSTRFTPEEWARLEERARLCGLAPARYLREVALGVEPKVRARAIERELLYHLAPIGNNLNQLAHAANALRRVELSARLERTLSALELAFERVHG